MALPLWGPWHFRTSWKKGWISVIIHIIFTRFYHCWRKRRCQRNSLLKIKGKRKCETHPSLDHIARANNTLVLISQRHLASSPLKKDNEDNIWCNVHQLYYWNIVRKLMAKETEYQTWQRQTFAPPLKANNGNMWIDSKNEEETKRKKRINAHN